MNYSFTQIRKGIILVEADSQYSLCSMFLRPQEHYESPYENIRGRHFTLEEYMDTYAKDKGSFSYYTDWCGFNIPSESFKKFVELFQYDMSAKENLLVSSIRKLIPNLEGKFYIIGTCKGKMNREALEHETAHAFWYLDEDYKATMDTLLVRKIPVYKFESANEELISVGYDSKVVKDEMQAYLATASREKILRMFGWSTNSKIPRAMRKFYQDYQKSHR